MTALGKLFRMTAFKLSLAYLAIFTIFAFVILGYVAWNARRVLDDQIVSTIEAEINGLSEQYRQGGLRRLVAVVEQRASEPGASLYLVTTPNGERVVVSTLTSPRDGMRVTPLDRNGEEAAAPAAAAAPAQQEPLDIRE